MSWVRNGVGLKSAEDTGTLTQPRRTYGQGRRRDIRGEGTTKSKVLLPLRIKCNENISQKNTSSFCSDDDHGKENEQLWEDVGENSVDKNASEDDLSLHGESSLLGAAHLKKQLNAKELSFSYCSSSYTSHEREEEEGGACKEDNSLLNCSHSISHGDSSRMNHNLTLSITPHQTSKTLPDDHEIVDTSFDDITSETINRCGEKSSSSSSSCTQQEMTSYFENRRTNSRNGDGGGSSPLALGICNLSPILVRTGFELENDGVMCLAGSEPNLPHVVAHGCSIKVTDSGKHQSIPPEYEDNASCQGNSSHGVQNGDGIYSASNTVREERKEDTFPDCTQRKLSVTGLHKTGVAGRRMTAMSGLKFPHNKSLESKRRNVSMAKLRRVSMGIKIHENIGMQARERHHGNLMKRVEELKLDDETDSNKVLGLPMHYNADTTECKKHFTQMDVDLLSTVFEYLSMNQLKSASCTCQKWVKAGAYALASKSRNPQVFTATVLRNTFTRASFLSDGAFKRVYRVWNTTRQAEEALSVMDTETINRMGHEAVVAQELHFSVLSSALVRQGICPNFIETYGICSSTMDPHSAWDMTGEQNTNNIKADDGRLAAGSTEMKEPEPRYCFIGMELCGEGDAEGLLRRHGVLSVENTMCVLFQALFSLYSGRAEYGLRHGDIKLLYVF